MQVFLTIVAVIIFIVGAVYTYRKPEKWFSLYYLIAFVGLVGLFIVFFGDVQKISFDAKNAKGELVKITQEARSDAKEIQKIKASLKESQNEIEQYKKELVMLRDDLVAVKKGIVEIEYLSYLGKNIVPNPFHDRIMTKLNQLLELAIPDKKERANYVKEIEEYTKEKTKKFSKKKKE